jgi:hypothetical protein
LFPLIGYGVVDDGFKFGDDWIRRTSLFLLKTSNFGSFELFLKRDEMRHFDIDFAIQSYWLYPDSFHW